MSLLQSDAVVIKTYPLGEADKIVVAYTRKYGKVRGVASGARRMRSRFLGRLEPFSWIEISAFEKENQELIRIDKVDLIRSFGLLHGNYRCFLQLNLLGELVIETTPEREPSRHVLYTSRGRAQSWLPRHVHWFPSLRCSLKRCRLH